MCSKCKDFDEKIAHYRRIGVYIPDELTSNGIKQLIEQAIAGKSALHPKEAGHGPSSTICKSAT